MNDVTKSKRDKAGPLSRQDIADVLVSVGLPGQKRDEKVQVIKDLCKARGDGETNNHGVWDTLEDYPQY